MDIFLTEEELAREKDLFEAHEESYTPLAGRKCGLRDFVQDVGQDSDRPKPPPSC